MKLLPSSFIEIEINATVEQVDEAVIAVKTRLQREFSEYEDFALELVLREALMNAVKHGNDFDAGKKVHLEVTWDQHFFYIQIKDEGLGFSYVPKESAPLVPSNENGRGLPIIEHYAEQLEFNDRGNEIRIKVSILKSGRGC